MRSAESFFIIARMPMVVLKIPSEIDDRENGAERCRDNAQISSFMSNNINFYGRLNGEPQSCRALC